MTSNESFWRKNRIATFAEDFGIANRHKPGGTFSLKEEDFKRLNENLEQNKAGGPLTDDEKEWAAAIVYNYGMPWGG